MVTSTAPLYVPGRKIICTAEEIALEFHTRGWCAPESDRTWIDGVEGEPRFMVRRPATRYLLSAEVSPFLAPPHSLEIFINYFRVDYVEIAAPVFPGREARIGLRQLECSSGAQA
jgi:hypothetical protein